MTRCLLVCTSLLGLGIRIPACESPVAQVQEADTQEVKLTAAEEQDSYEIYSMLLRTEMGPQWKIVAWAIIRQTQTFPGGGSTHNVRQCINVPREQEAVYLPLVDNYTAKNNRKWVLERKFDLPQYELVEFGQRAGRASPPAASVTFDVSAVGFNRDRTRALVYVGHHCGNLCGGGGYHLLVKKEGKWQVDREYGGGSCIWVS
jgi:hypothetical protein